MGEEMEREEMVFGEKRQILGRRNKFGEERQKLGRRDKSGEEGQRWGGGRGEVGQDMDCRGGMGPPGAHCHTHTTLNTHYTHTHYTEHRLVN